MAQQEERVLHYSHPSTLWFGLMGHCRPSDNHHLRISYTSALFAPEISVYIYQ